MPPDDIAINVSAIRERIADAAARRGRAADAVKLVAVTKRVDAPRIARAYACGLRDFGESYVQEASAKRHASELAWTDARWHFIGHLQSNKARDVVGQYDLVQSVDSHSLAGVISRRLVQTGTTTDILMEVRLDLAAPKFGFEAEDTLVSAGEISRLPGIRLCGLMGMAPYGGNPEQARPYFHQLYTLFSQLPLASQQILSMGMTGDFEVAVEEGATLVRIGTGIFGQRP